MNDNNRKNTTLAIILVLAVGAFMYFVWDVIASRVETSEGEGFVCALDAMQCPDGSWVGRIGLDCQFVCPAGTSTRPSDGGVLLETRIGQEVSGLDVTISPLAVVEDSRCPADVQCIQAGMVRVRTLLVSGLGTSTMIFSIDSPITTEVEEVTLVSVAPAPEAGKTIPSKDYRFTFKVRKR